MKVVFMGTPAFAAPSLEYLLKNHQVLAVVTQPDRKQGRGNKLTPPVIKVQAEAAGVPVYQPEKVSQVKDELAALGADVFVVVAFGQILPVSVLSIPPRGCINIHGSLLPQLRGAAPIQWSLILGQPITGVTSMYMAKGMDTGDMLIKKELEILPEDDYGSLSERLSVLGAEALAETLTAMEAGTLVATPQNEAEATYAPKLTRDMEQVDWNQPAAEIRNRLRGFSPDTGLYTFVRGEKLKLWAMEVRPGQEGAVCGQVIGKDKKGFLVQTGAGALYMTQVQGVGGKRLPAGDYLRGHDIPVGEVLE